MSLQLFCINTNAGIGESDEREGFFQTANSLTRFRKGWRNLPRNQQWTVVEEPEAPSPGQSGPDFSPPVSHRPPIDEVSVRSTEANFHGFRPQVSPHQRKLTHVKAFGFEFRNRIRCVITCGVNRDTLVIVSHHEIPSTAPHSVGVTSNRSGAVCPISAMGEDNMNASRIQQGQCRGSRAVGSATWVATDRRSRGHSRPISFMNQGKTSEQALAIFLQLLQIGHHKLAVTGDDQSSLLEILEVTVDHNSH